MNQLFLLRLSGGVLTALLFISVCPPLSAQNLDSISEAQLRVQVANLMQDLDLLRHKVVRLSEDILTLRQKNARLQERLIQQEQRKFPTPREDLISRENLNEALGRVQQTWQQQIKTWQEEISQEQQKVANKVSQQIYALSQRFNQSLQALAETLEAEPQLAQEQEFAQDYPKQGMPYIVKSGDTLSEIAQKFNASVRDIQNANRISQPSRDLRVGQTIFIPQKR